MKKLLPVLEVWIISVLVWGIYRYFFRFGEITDELIFKPLIFVLPVLIYLRIRERLDLGSLSLSDKNLPYAFIWGIIVGLLLLIELFIISVFKDKSIDVGFFIPQNLAINLLISVFTAVCEEILYRGFIMSRLWKILKSGYVANFLAAGLFCLAHVGMAVLVLNYSGLQLAVYLWLMFILGLANGLVFQKTRSTYGPIITHAFWNFGNALFI